MSEKKVWTLRKLEELLDEVKDSIDQLHSIANPKRRLEVARDLVEYITRHHIDYPTG